jgi:hypothetical protein
MSSAITLEPSRASSVEDQKSYNFFTTNEEFRSKPESFHNAYRSQKGSILPEKNVN